MSRTLGIIGGGQLAMLMSRAARTLGVETRVLSPDEVAPARGDCDHFVCAPYESFTALDELIKGCSAITIDHEHVPLGALQYVAEQVDTSPRPQGLARIQDRLQQRGLLDHLNVPQVRYRPIDKASAVRAAMRAESFPAVLKRRSGGYDGHGQRYVSDPSQLPKAWEALQQAPCVLESWLSRIQEFSIVGARGADGQARLFPPIGNLHRDGQLVESAMPFPLTPQAQREATDIWHRIVDELDHRGVLTVEFFLSEDGQVLVNEIAPRVHNSGHVTQWACRHCQFEMHVRGVMGMPLPDPEHYRDAAMLNIYPQHPCHAPDIARAWQEEHGGRILLYGKSPQPRRKMGHWLLLPAELEAARRALAGEEPYNSAPVHTAERM